jgi:CheY-like chemotaxis protein
MKGACATAGRAKLPQLEWPWPVESAKIHRRLPHLAASETKQNPESSRTTMNSRPNKILIADDNTANVELLEAYLADINCEVATASDGQETLDCVQQWSPDIILLDVMMPKFSGFEVCKKIKDDPQTRKIMVLMVTALNELGDIERAVASGTDDFLSKPVQKIELLKRVENMLRLKDVTDEVERLRQYIEEMEAPQRNTADGPLHR